jgi:hypothetical protein
MGELAFVVCRRELAKIARLDLRRRRVQSYMTGGWSTATSRRVNLA